MPVNKNLLKVGDILIQHNNAGRHSLIVISNDGDKNVAHVETFTTGCIIQKFDEACTDSRIVDAFRFPEEEVATSAAEAAERWSMLPTQQLKFGTPYGSFPSLETVSGASRYAAVRKLRSEGLKGIPFGYDALFRTFKWGQKTSAAQEFSKNHGTTCAAFVAAAYQAAAMLKFIREWGGPPLHLRVYQYLSANRGKKVDRIGVGKEVSIPKPRSDVKTKHTFYQNQAYIENSNRGSKEQQVNTKITSQGEGEGIEGYWADVKKQFTELEWATDTLADILTPQLMFDAKFAHTDALWNAVKQEGGKWAAVA